MGELCSLCLTVMEHRGVISAWVARPAVRLVVPHALLFSTYLGEESRWLCLAPMWK